MEDISMIQLAKYFYYSEQTRKLETTEYFIRGREVDRHKYKEFVDSMDKQHAEIMGLNIKKEIPPSLQINSNLNQSCPTNCPDCGEPYDGAYQIQEQGSEHHPPECECIDCLSSEIINKCLYFVLNTNSTEEQKAVMILNACMAMREIGFSECELENESEVYGDTYNINVTVNNSKNASKVIGNIVNEVKKNGVTDKE